MTAPAQPAPTLHPLGDGPGALGVSGSEVAPGDRLRRDRDGVECEGEEGPDGQGQLHGGEVGLAESRRGVRHHEQGGTQHQRAHDQRYAGAASLSDPGQVRTQRCAFPARGPEHHPHQRDGRADLRQQRAVRRPGDAQPRAVHQRDVEGDVGEVADHGHDQRGARVLQAAQHPGRREHQQQGHRAEQRDPQVGDGELGHPVAGSEQVHELPHQRKGERGDGDADQGRQPEPVDALGQRAPGVPRADLAGDRGGGAVGEEDAQADQRAQDRRRDPQGSQLRGAEVADDRRVREQEQGLGDQCQEGRNGEPEDLPVLRLPLLPGRPAIALGVPAPCPPRDYHPERLNATLTCAKPGDSVHSPVGERAMSTKELVSTRWPTGEHQ